MSVPLPAFLIILIASFLLYVLIANIVKKPHPKFPPGPLRWPIWGGYLQLLIENYIYPYKGMHSMARRYKTDVLGMYLGNLPTIVACSAESVRELLLKPEFQGRVPAFVPQIRDGDGVIRGQFFIDGHMWTEQRRFMLRALRDFGFGTRSKIFESVVEEEIRDFIERVQTNIKGVSHKGQVEAPSIFYPLFLNFSVELFFRSRLPSSLHSKLRDFALAALKFQVALDPTTGAINMTPWIRYVAPNLSGYNDIVESNNYIKKFIQEMINEHKESFMSDALRDFCDVYLKEMGEKQGSDTVNWFSEEQLVMTMWDTMFPSAMAVTGTLTFAVEFLLHHPEVQTKVQSEIDEVVGRSRLPNLDDRKNLPYTESVLREVMRAETLTPLSIPHMCTENTYFRGYFIPKDTMVMANLWSCHIDENVWEDPYDFKPQRFLDERGQLKKKDMSMPFGLGKRLCAGETFARQNMFLVFSGMMQNFTLELPDGDPLPDFKKHITGLNLAPFPFKVKMTPREMGNKI